jgi:Cys-tRNA(Pro)/Cys-tRNA(Cys) deacylase
MSARGTRATDELRRAGVPFTTHEYEAPARAGAARDERPEYGLEAARALGVEQARIFKTLVAAVDGRLGLAVVPVSGSLVLKAFADALGGRRAELAPAAEAERATGYVIGGISPIGTRRRLPTVVDASVDALSSIYCSAGRRGLQVELAPSDLIRVTGATVAPIGR